MTGKVYEIIKGIREIKLFQSEGFAYKRIFKPLKHLIVLGNKKRIVDFRVNKLIRLVNLFASVIIYGFSMYLVANGKLTIGVFISITEYIALLHRKFNWMLKIYLDWFNRKASIDRVNEVLGLEGEAYQGMEIPNIDSVEFQNVCFSYNNGKKVLNNCSFIINKGEKVGIVGKSGTGKTTIVSLLLELFAVEDGLILINGIPISEINPTSLRNSIGVVSQEIIIFDGTIRYNLCLGNNYSDNELYHALDMVGLTEIIRKLPEGIDTVISPATNDLSGGQKQRIMIARILLKKPDLIVLDEATSALDIETEKNIIEFLSGFSENTTMLIISHRFEAIRDCERIMVLDGHGIVDVGTHDELLETSPVYCELFG
jgi:ABC-type multidrug transport system fused ATPase/permease subunit